jgi:hypothetical protein
VKMSGVKSVGSAPGLIRVAASEAGGGT